MAWPDEGEDSAELTPPATALPGFSEFIARLRGRATDFRLVPQVGGGSSVWVSASPRELEALLAELEADGWQVRRRRPGSLRALDNFREMVSLWFFAPGREMAGHRVEEPLLGHVVAPLLLLGVAEAFRRRRDPVIRALVAWVLGAMLIPGTVALAFPQRAVVALPFVFALAALPIAAVVPNAARPLARRRAAALAIALLAAVAASGTHAYFGRWYTPSQGVGLFPGADFLAYSKLLKHLPEDLPILATPALGALEEVREKLEAEPVPLSRRVRVQLRATGTGAVHRISCQEAAPFLWISRDTAAERQLLDALGRGFEVKEELHEPYRVVYVTGHDREACRGAWRGVPPTTASTCATRLWRCGWAPGI